MAQTQEKELEQIIRSAEKAVHYGQSDPETALLHARKSAEAICRDVYKKEFKNLTERLSLGQMIEALSKGKEILPKKVMYSLRVIQNFGGVNAHENIDECLEPALEFFSIITTWYFEDYKNESVPTPIRFYRVMSRPFFPPTGEQVVSLSNSDVDDSSTLVRAKDFVSSRIENFGSNIKQVTFSEEFRLNKRKFGNENPTEVNYGRVFKTKPFLSVESNIPEGKSGSCEFEVVEQRIDGFKIVLVGYSETIGDPKYLELKFTVTGNLE